MSSKNRGGNFIISYENFKDAMDIVFDKEEYVKKVRAQSLKELESTENIQDEPVENVEPEKVDDEEDYDEIIEPDPNDNSEGETVLIRKNELLL